MTATPVVTSVSQATRPFVSCFMTSSSTASEIWSAILSGWPSVTDSDVNKKLRKASLKLILLRDLRGTHGCKHRCVFSTLLNLTKLSFAQRRINALIPGSLLVRQTVEIRLRTANCCIHWVRARPRLDHRPAGCRASPSPFWPSGRSGGKGPSHHPSHGLHRPLQSSYD